MSDTTPTSDAHNSAVREEDALDMWCPEARLLYADEDGSGAAINRRHKPYTSEHMPPETIAACIGSRCMAWRWVRPGRVLSRDDPPVLAGEYSHGYCGKAGGR